MAELNKIGDVQGYTVFLLENYLPYNATSLDLYFQLLYLFISLIKKSVNCFLLSTPLTLTPLCCDAFRPHKLSKVGPAQQWDGTPQRNS